MHDDNTPIAATARDDGWFNQPNPEPRRRKPMEQLLAELAERNGDPVFPVQPFSHAVIHTNARSAKAAS